MASQNNENKEISALAQYSVAMPYLALFNQEGIPVENPTTGIPLGAYISNFTYTYDSEKHNLATITFETGNPDVVDTEDLREGKTIFVQWGYIFPNGEALSSEVKAVRIRDFNCTFDSTGTICTLKCLDGTSMMNHIPGHAPNSEEDDETHGMVKFMDDGCAAKIGIIIEAFY